MDFGWSDDAAKRIPETYDFARALESHRVTGRANELDRDTWQACGEFGIFGLAVPEKYGGSAQELTTVVGILEALGGNCRDTGLLFALGAQMWAATLFATRRGPGRALALRLSTLGEVSDQPVPKPRGLFGRFRFQAFR